MTGGEGLGTDGTDGIRILNFFVRRVVTLPPPVGVLPYVKSEAEDTICSKVKMIQEPPANHNEDRRNKGKLSI